tara:strand:+ start:1096 stop:1539 length:444 start_codon:yes stop_codon:yes gene_type:complete
MNQKEQKIMNKLQIACINKEFKACNKNKFFKNSLKGWFLEFMISDGSSALIIFKTFLIGLLHCKEQQSFGIILGFFSYQLQLSANKLNIHSIRITNLFSFGFVKSDNNEAVGLLINTFNINLQLMIGKKRKLRNQLSSNVKRVLAKA